MKKFKDREKKLNAQTDIFGSGVVGRYVSQNLQRQQNKC